MLLREWSPGSLLETGKDSGCHFLQYRSMLHRVRTMTSPKHAFFSSSMSQKQACTRSGVIFILYLYLLSSLEVNYSQSDVVDGEEGDEDIINTAAIRFVPADPSASNN